MNNKYILDINSISKSYDEYKILNDFSCGILPGEIIGIVGKNGVGKTTLIKSILGLTHIDTGRIVFYGGDRMLYGKGIPHYVTGMVESPKLYENLSGIENIKMYASLYGKIDMIRINNILNQLELQSSIKKKVLTYSLGTKQKIYIAMIFSIEADIYILDEPMNGLDPVVIKVFREFMVNLVRKKNKAIILSSHNLPECEKLCNRYIFMKKNCKYKLFNENEIYRKKQNAWRITLSNKIDEFIKQLEELGKSHKFEEVKNFVEVERIEKNLLFELLEKYEVQKIERVTDSLEEFFLKWEKEENEI